VTILVVGGDSAEILRRQAGRAQGQVEHWSGRKTRVLTRPVPKAVDASVVVLDRVSHASVKKVRHEASPRGFPVYFQKRSGRIETGERRPIDGPDFFRHYQDAS